MSRLEGARELNMIGIIQSTMLNLRILAAELLRNCVFRIFGLLHGFDVYSVLAKESPGGVRSHSCEENKGQVRRDEKYGGGSGLM